MLLSISVGSALCLEELQAFEPEDAGGSGRRGYPVTYGTGKDLPPSGLLEYSILDRSIVLHF